MRPALLALLGLLGCGTSPPARTLPARAERPPVVLVSLDGFRWDYLDRGLTPALATLAREGARASALVPVFPTKTFPNHYSIVTGLYPARHGIVGNEFSAPDVGARFTMRDRAAVRSPRFWLGEPVWVAAERAGLPTAPIFWPGSEAAIGGRRPTWWRPYDHSRADTSRIREALDLLALPAGRRPAFVTLYFSLVDAAGHEYGPDAPETDSAIVLADRLVARLEDGLARLGEPVNLLVVSDHGMAAVSPDRVVWLDDVIRRDWLESGEPSPVLMAWPRPGMEDSVVRGLARARHLRVYRRDELPTRWRLAGSPRVAPVVAVADEGWTMRWRPRPGETPYALRGEHGYDDTLRSMGGVFLARGPAFRRGAVTSRFRNVHVYPLLAELLGVAPALTDGSLDSVQAMLAAPGSSAPGLRAASAPAPRPRVHSSGSRAPR